ncbi:MAG: hypothetical protein FWD49_06830 [Firmicutes bacterium]|nr:hypothetical protein [Bacillota bacterium]
MNKNPFQILGISENATQEELFSAYRAKRCEYEDKRFTLGEEGTKACEMLDKIDEAYREADGILKNRAYIVDYNSDFSGIEAMIKEGRFEDAQDGLNRIHIRTGEWHYLQAIIFYKKMWYNEAMEQLRLALEKEPMNERYRESYGKLDLKLKSQSGGRGFYGEPQQGRSYQNYNNAGMHRPRCGCCEICGALVCLDCLCNCC